MRHVDQQFPVEGWPSEFQTVWPHVLVVGARLQDALQVAADRVCHAVEHVEAHQAAASLESILQSVAGFVVDGPGEGAVPVSSVRWTLSHDAPFMVASLLN